ncbi:hypothetical protein TcG_00833 [Trypanosoma cruzi]|uniref:Uncharacterized protein n=1 Tax=Trypanosoma cruzi TaxID=5693 RepID=A0A2V2VFG9_TRYCR|nr:hypothetical protein C4B63_23g1292c [Trypanosoma cruzi]RNF24347.1 hypothetical protein TcG_00833 [Trypanosoma cruzi]
MCQVGTKDWVFTDSQSCFLDRDLRLQKCVCPISTCDVTPLGNACRFTSFFLVFCGFLFAIWLLGVAAYVYVSGLIWERHKPLLPERTHFMRGGYYFEKMFGGDKRNAGVPIDDSPK